MDKNIFSAPVGRVDVVLDTDAYNEIDDQFAISYLLRSCDRLNTVAIYAAPFHNSRSSGPRDGMLRSYDEILRILPLCGRADLSSAVYRGSEGYLADEHTPVVSDAAEDLVRRARTYTGASPLYVVAIGAITNVASALLIDPDIRDRIVVVWLGGHSLEYDSVGEFNMVQDIAAARVVMSSGVPFVQLPCCGVVSEFRLSEADLDRWLIGKNPLADYLARNTKETANAYAEGRPWTRVIWDVTAVAWLLNDGDRFMKTRVVKTRLPAYGSSSGYEAAPLSHSMCYVYYIKRDELMQDLFDKILAE